MPAMTSASAMSSTASNGGRAAFVAWARAAALPLTTTEPGQPDTDLRPLLPLLQGARAVGLGEATHGTREFFQLKHRLLGLLVDHASTDRFLIEASLPEALDVDRHVRTGTPAADVALAGMRFWVWNTEEVLELVHDLRRRQLARSATQPPLRFLGFDLQFPSVGARRLVALARDGGREPAWCAPLAVLGEETFAETWKGLDEKLRAPVREAVAAAVRDVTSGALPGSTVEDEWCAAVLSAWLEMSDAPEIWSTRRVRDRLMAELVVRQSDGASGPAVVWAHNQHVAFDGFGHVRPDSGPLLSMGGHLREKLGDGYVCVGFAFGEGGFQASNETEGLRPMAVPAPPADSLDAALAEVGLPLYALDLRGLPAGGARDYLRGLPATKLVGSGYYGRPEQVYAGQDLTAQYDLLVFVARTSAARGLPCSLRTPVAPSEPAASVPPLTDAAWRVDDGRRTGGMAAYPLGDGSLLVVAGSDRWRHRQASLRLLLGAGALPPRFAFCCEVRQHAPSDGSSARLCVTTGGRAWLSDVHPGDGEWRELRVTAEADGDVQLAVSVAGTCPVVVRNPRVEALA